MNRKYPFIVLLIITLIVIGSQLVGCGSDYPCISQTTDAPPPIELTLTAADVDANSLCNAQIILQDENFVAYVQHGTAVETGCSFRMGHQGPGTYDIQVRVQGYEPLLLDAVESTVDQCGKHQTVELTEQLLPAATNCHDGYSFVDDTCKTVNGCEFPQLEFAIIPGIQGAQITYECVNGCVAPDGETVAMPVSPGQCGGLALP